MAEPKVVQGDFKAFERFYQNMLADANAERTDAVGILQPKDLSEKKIDRLVKAKKSLVLAYGRNGDIREYTPADLREFLASKRAIEATFNPKGNGVLLGDLERASSYEDVVRSKAVRNATLYKVQGNLLTFRVTATGSTPQCDPPRCAYSPRRLDKEHAQRHKPYHRRAGGRYRTYLFRLHLRASPILVPLPCHHGGLCSGPHRAWLSQDS